MFTCVFQSMFTSSHWEEQKLMKSLLFFFSCKTPTSCGALGPCTMHMVKRKRRELGNQNGYLAAKTQVDFDSKLIVLDAGCSWSKWLRELISGMGAPLTGDGRGHEGGKGVGGIFPLSLS